MSSPAQTSTDSSGSFLKRSPILGSLVILTFVNWFVFFGVSMYLGGDAIGMLPSKDGFVVTSHGHHKAVSESQWAFSLFYSGATLLITPAIWIAFAAVEHGKKMKQARWGWRLFIFGFILVWCLGWYSSIGSSMRRSFQDWQKLKRPNPPVAGNTGAALELAFQYLWPGVPEPGRWVMKA